MALAVLYSLGHTSPNMLDTRKRSSAKAISTLWRCDYLLRLLSGLEWMGLSSEVLDLMDGWIHRRSWKFILYLPWLNYRPVPAEGAENRIESRLLELSMGIRWCHDPLAYNDHYGHTPASSRQRRYIWKAWPRRHGLDSQVPFKRARFPSKGRDELAVRTWVSATPYFSHLIETQALLGRRMMSAQTTTTSMNKVLTATSILFYAS